MAVIGLPLINGVEYVHANILINILGTPVVGVTDIKYSDIQAIENNYATGSEPVSRTFGTIVYEGSITLLQKEVQRLSAAAPNGRIQDIPDFDIGVNFGTEVGDFQRHRLGRCRFKGRNMASTVNNTQIEEEIQLSIGFIKYV
jgi:hypothetical protein